MPDNFDIVALAASAGGLKALTDVLAALPGSFPASLVVVQHLDPRHRSLMADILSRRTAMPVKEAAEGDVLASGRVYVAPPNRHLLVNPDRSLSLTQTELVHFVRPSARRAPTTSDRCPARNSSTAATPSWTRHHASTHSGRSDVTARGA